MVATPSSTSSGGRVFVDASTLARWTGPPVGMIRVEHELAKAARARGGAYAPVFFDQRCGAFRAIRPEWSDLLLGWRGAIDTWGLDYNVERRGWRKLLPSRYPLLQAIERRRLTARLPGVAAALEALQALVLSMRPHRFPFKNARGQRISLLPPELALGPAYDLSERDVVLSPASNWWHKDVEKLWQLKSRAGFRLAVLCHDVIPLTHPQFFPAVDVSTFTFFWRHMFTIADTVIVTSQAVRDDVLHYCAHQALPAPNLAVIPLGSEPAPPSGAGRALRSDLEPERYALFVSTIEPRKNHALLIRVWRDLVARGVPQRHSFKLVFVGRSGWMVDEVLRTIGDGSVWKGHLVHLQGVDDEELETLYAHAAFCLYPSIYEGFGLPVVEAFARGKAVIASNGGSLREVVGDLAPCLDPMDEAAWTAAIESWIQDPEARRRAELRVQAGFSHRSWAEVAAAMLAAASRPHLREENDRVLDRVPLAKL